MDEIILEKLELEEKQLASNSQRILAYFVDSLLCYVLLFILFQFNTSNEQLQNLAKHIQEQDLEIVYAALSPYIMYFLLIKSSYLLLFFYMYGATLGNMITKCKIVNYEHFDKPNFTQSTVRTIVFMICDVFLYGVLFLSIFFNKTKRHFADSASKSVVIKVA